MTLTRLVADINTETLRQLPKVAGAYILVIDLSADLVLRNKRFAGAILRRGTYLYCGSANGSGGIAARVKRHCRTEKKQHWHVDELTNGTGYVVAMLVMPDGCECDLRAALGMVPGISIPIAGFGSSDCARCPAHLLAAESHAVAMTAIEQVRKAFT